LTDPQSTVLVDAALRGALVTLLLLLAYALGRDRPRLAPARAGRVLSIGLCLQTLSATPVFEAKVPWAVQIPLIAVSAGNAVLFWVFVQAMFDD
jgi:hypothetical protein